eukprot:2708788-Alexandrium_andersonii.AAC.1
MVDSPPAGKAGSDLLHKRVAGTPSEPPPSKRRAMGEDALRAAPNAQRLAHATLLGRDNPA